MVSFDASNNGNCEIAGQAALCARLFNFSNYKGVLTISSSLTVVGSKPNPSTFISGDSLWIGKSGSLVQTALGATMNLNGGKMVVGSNWNDGATSVLSDFNVYNGAYLKISNNAAAMGDNLLIGVDAQKNASAATAEVTGLSANLSMINNAGAYVGTQGTLKFTGDGTAPGGGAVNAVNGMTTSGQGFINNFGTLLRDGALKGSVTCGLYVRNNTGGTFQVNQDSRFQVTGMDPANKCNVQNNGTVQLGDNTTLDVSSLGLRQDSGNGLLATLTRAGAASAATIQGNVTLNAGNSVICYDNNTVYGILNITGDLTLAGTANLVAYIDGNGTACDLYKVNGKTNLDPNNGGQVTIQVIMNVAPKPGSPPYVILKAGGGVVGTIPAANFKITGAVNNGTVGQIGANDLEVVPPAAGGGGKGGGP